MWKPNWCPIQLVCKPKQKIGISKFFHAHTLYLYPSGFFFTSRQKFKISAAQVVNIFHPELLPANIALLELLVMEADTSIMCVHEKIY